MSGERFARYADPAAWGKAYDATLGAQPFEALPAEGPTSLDRRIYHLGSEAARERIWIQCDTADEPSIAVVPHAIVEALTGALVGRYKQLVVGRAALAVVTPAGTVMEAAAGEGWHAGGAGPLLDGGQLGLTPGILRAMDRFTPTLVVHLQDWTRGAGHAPWEAALDAPTSGGRRPPPAGLRQLESFYLPPDLHDALATAARTRFGRPTAVARALAASPEARIGAQVRRHVARAGYRLYDAAAEAYARDADPTWRAVLRLETGRYAPRLEWRRLQAASLAEAALARYGALGLCAQTAYGSPPERAGAALAFAEGAILQYLGIATQETAP